VKDSFLLTSVLHHPVCWALYEKKNKEKKRGRNFLRRRRIRSEGFFSLTSVLHHPLMLGFVREEE